MQPTQLLYMEDFTLMQNTATVVDCVSQEGTSIVILDKTIFYPQGGGQPYDQGVIGNDSGTFIVNEVRFVDGIVKHIGTFEHGTFQAGQTVTCTVNKERRALMSRLHSAGHVVDIAVQKLGYAWTPGKGYHFPDGPYVEYTGTLPDEDKEKLKAEIESFANQFITEGHQTKLIFMPKEEMSTVCKFVPDYLPANKPARVVMYGAFGIPCGGTHVSNLKSIKKLTIRKIKTKGDSIRVSYDIEQ